MGDEKTERKGERERARGAIENKMGAGRRSINGKKWAAREARSGWSAMNSEHYHDRIARTNPIEVGEATSPHSEEEEEEHRRSTNLTDHYKWKARIDGLHLLLNPPPPPHRCQSTCKFKISPFFFLFLFFWCWFPCPRVNYDRKKRILADTVICACSLELLF